MKHNMDLVSTHPEDLEEWVCPICGHRVLIQWEPFKRIIIEDGDTEVLHIGLKTPTLDI